MSRLALISWGDWVKAIAASVFHSSVCLLSEAAARVAALPSTSSGPGTLPSPQISPERAIASPVTRGPSIFNSLSMSSSLSPLPFEVRRDRLTSASSAALRVSGPSASFTPGPMSWRKPFTCFAAAC